MTLFLTIGGLGCLLVLALLLRPFLFQRTAAKVSRRQLNAAIYRDQFERLARDRAENMLTEADYAQAKEELQRRVLEDASDEETAATLETPRKTVLLVGLLIPAMAIGLYWHLGSPAALDSANVAQQPTHAAGQHHTTPQEIERLAAGLVKKLEQDPGNLQGWSMLARTYKMLGRNAEAEQAFERAGSFLDNDAQLLASYADLAAANANGNFAGKPNQLIAKALKVDPDNPMALWLAGTAAFRSSDFGTAIRVWERLLAKLDPQAEDTQMLQGAIEDAYARMGKPVPDKVGARTPPSLTGEDTKAQAGASVSGVVDLDKALKGRVAATDAVLVIARIPGMRMPAAVLRARAADLPITFTLDDSLSMSPQARLSSASQVEVEARISKSGMAQPEPGDLISAVQTVRVGASGIKLHVNQVRP